MDAVRVIQTLVAPVVMISACGLLCLAFFNRLSILVARVRTFHHERLALSDKLKTAGAGEDVHRRMAVVDQQVTHILSRARMIRNTLFCLLLCVSCMVLCSISLGVSVFVDWGGWPQVEVTLFMVGLLCLLTGVMFAMVELTRALTPVALERDYFIGRGQEEGPSIIE